MATLVEAREESQISSVLVHQYVKLWPREVFYMRKAALQRKIEDTLSKSGVYVLYQDFDVFYIGKAGNLFERLEDHARKRYRLWNHFSAFLVDTDHLAEVEALMIAATPRTANKSGGKELKKLRLPREIQEVLDADRQIPTATASLDQNSTLIAQ